MKQSFLRKEISTGHEYEHLFSYALRLGLPMSSVIEANETQDEQEGTDAFLDGIRVDFTFAFAAKDHMVTRISRYVESLGLWFGIRTGNNTKSFGKEDFVVVVGITAEPSYVRDWVMPNLEKWGKENAGAIADEINDIYCEYLDSLAA